MKTYSKCGHSKDESEFYRRTNGRLMGSCKVCVCAQILASRRVRQAANPSHKADYNAYSRERNRRIKDAVFAAYGGYKCNCCKETEESFLSIDHINNDGAKWRREQLGSRLKTGHHTYSWLVRHNFPGGYQVLCMNCQIGKAKNGGVCPHQARRNDHPLVGVGSSEPKRTAPCLKLVG